MRDDLFYDHRREWRQRAVPPMRSAKPPMSGNAASRESFAPKMSARIWTTGVGSREGSVGTRVRAPSFKVVDRPISFREGSPFVSAPRGMKLDSLGLVSMRRWSEPVTPEFPQVSALRREVEERRTEENPEAVTPSVRTEGVSAFASFAPREGKASFERREGVRIPSGV